MSEKRECAPGGGQGPSQREARALTPNDKTAQRLREEYWLYVVFNCATRPHLIPVQDPLRLDWEPMMKIEHYQILPEQLEGTL